MAFVAEADAERALDILRSCPVSARASAIGRVHAAARGSVRMRGAIGGSRLIDMLSGEQLPRIC